MWLDEVFVLQSRVGKVLEGIDLFRMDLFNDLFFKATHSQKSYGITKIKMNPAFVKAILKFGISSTSIIPKEIFLEINSSGIKDLYFKDLLIQPIEG